MNHIDLQPYTISEKISEEYLQIQGILQRFDHFRMVIVTGLAESGAASSSVTVAGNTGGHDMNPDKFPRYPKELESRYNHRHDDLYDDPVKNFSLEYPRVAPVQ